MPKLLFIKFEWQKILQFPHCGEFCRYIPFCFRKKNPNAKIPKHVQAYFDAEFLKSNSILMSSIKLVIGLHPDEATEPLVIYKAANVDNIEF